MVKFAQVLSANSGEVIKRARKRIVFEKAKFKPNMRLIESKEEFDISKPAITFCFEKPYEYSVRDAIRRFEGVFWYQPMH